MHPAIGRHIPVPHGLQADPIPTLLQPLFQLRRKAFINCKFEKKKASCCREMSNAVFTTPSFSRSCHRLKQRKRSYPIAKFLMELGVNRRNAWNTAKSEKGWWRLSSSPSVSQALSNAWFEKQGLISLYQRATVKV